MLDGFNMGKLGLDCTNHKGETRQLDELDGYSHLVLMCVYKYKPLSSWSTLSNGLK